MFNSCMMVFVWQCKGQPEMALYNGGILKDEEPVSVKGSIGGSASNVFWPAFIYCTISLRALITISWNRIYLCK